MTAIRKPARKRAPAAPRRVAKRASASRRFRGRLEAGHKGAAVIVPFDPEDAWGLPATPVASAAYGVRPGHLVSGTLNGRPFQGWIGQRWGRFFLLVDEALQRAAGIAPGDPVTVQVRPRGQS